MLCAQIPFSSVELKNQYVSSSFIQCSFITTPTHIKVLTDILEAGAIKQSFSTVLGGFQVRMCSCWSVKQGVLREGISFSMRLKHYEQGKSLLSLRGTSCYLLPAELNPYLLYISLASTHSTYLSILPLVKMYPNCCVTVQMVKNEQKSDNAR